MLKNTINVLAILIVSYMQSHTQADSNWMNMYPRYDTVIFSPSTIVRFEDTVNNPKKKEWLDRRLTRYSYFKEGLPGMGLGDSMDETVVSITFLPTFHNPVFVSVAKEKHKYTLSWVVRKGMGGYDFKGIKRRGRTSISEEDWNRFLQILDIKSFDTIPVDVWFPIADGAGWVVEISKEDKQIIHFTNWPDKGIEEAFQFLLHFADYKKVAHGYFRHGKVFVNRHNEIVSQSTIRNSILVYLNQNLPEEHVSSCCLACFDLRMKISNKGRISKVRHLPDKPFIDFWEFTEDIAIRVTERGCRRTIRNTLKGLDLSDFNLSTTWVEVSED